MNDVKTNKRAVYSSPLEVTSKLNISIKSLVKRIKTKSLKPINNRYIVKVYKDQDEILIKNWVLFYSDNGEMVTFKSINSARLYFNVKWSIIKKNIDKDRIVNLKGVSWRIISLSLRETI